MTRPKPATLAQLARRQFWDTAFPAGLLAHLHARGSAPANIRRQTGSDGR